ncbi:MAG: MarR family transcriptional regulator [Bacteroidales bacterium]|jgi:DNA-binding MarR family transcriptional regulator|nr:MarR family transcriptional regulator [Bacteroidales bacterium]
MNESPLCKIREINKAIAEYETIIVRDYGLSLNEGMLLCCLSEKGTISSSDIAKALGLTCSNTSKVIKSVESKNLIRRYMSDEDKRSMLFSITSEGEKKMRQLLSDTENIPDALKKILNY